MREREGHLNAVIKSKCELENMKAMTDDYEGTEATMIIIMNRRMLPMTMSIPDVLPTEVVKSGSLRVFFLRLMMLSLLTGRPCIF